MTGDSSKQDDVAVVITPLVLQSHLRQLLQFACRISAYGLPVYYLSSATANNQARTRTTSLSPSEIAKIHFHDLPENNQDPPEGIPFHIWNATMRARDSIASFLRDISPKFRRVVLIHDLMMCYNVQDVASIPNAEAYMFYCTPSFDNYCSHYAPYAGFPIPLEEELLKRIPSNDGCYNPEDLYHHSKLMENTINICVGYVYDTSKVIEGPFVDLMRKFVGFQNKKLWAVGPVLPTTVPAVKNQHFCLDWLDKQPPRSVIFVSFGTSTSHTDEQIKELAKGLELSKQRFIWVLREADKGGDPVTNKTHGIRTGPVELPEGFEERVKGMGIVVREWAPQTEILAHPATGGFMTHCGWTSCLESIAEGVPIAAWPIQFDQPKNGFYLADVLKIGLLVFEWDKREELVPASTIQSVVTRLIASEEGDAIRKRAQELAEEVRRSTEKGGCSQLELDSFVEHIKR